MCKYNLAHVQKECTAFPAAIFAQLTFSPFDLAHRLFLRLDSEVWIEISLKEQRFVVKHTTRQTQYIFVDTSCTDFIPIVWNRKIWNTFYLRP